MIIAVTGSIGSGKSFVGRELAAQLQAEHSDTDQLCREFLETGNKGWLGVIKQWGREFLKDDDSIDRAKLREAIFADPAARKMLENILHPLVRRNLDQLIRQCRRSGAFLVVEIPLLFETGWQHDFEVIVAVAAERRQCVERIMQRDGVSCKQAGRVLDTQMSVEEKIKRSHHVIDNSGPQEKTRRAVAALALKLQEKNDPKKAEAASAKTLDS